MVNLYNGGAKDFAELWEIMHLNIWTHFLSDKQNYSEFNLKHYSQTCWNDHLHETTTRLKRPMLGPPKQIPVQLLPCKTTTYLTRPATTFFVTQMKKVCLKQPLKIYSEEMQNKHKEQCIKNKHPSDYIFSFATL